MPPIPPSGAPVPGLEDAPVPPPVRRSRGRPPYLEPTGQIVLQLPERVEAELRRYAFERGLALTDVAIAAFAVFFNRSDQGEALRRLLRES